MNKYTFLKFFIKIYWKLTFLVLTSFLYEFPAALNLEILANREYLTATRGRK